MNIAKSMAIGATLLGTTVAGAENTYGKYEAPPYTVVQKIQNVELRAYDPHVLAEVDYRGERRASLSKGFRTLAGYFFGGNQEGQKVAMTVPVAQRRQDDSLDGAWTISFMMPAKYNLDSLPTPEASNINFRTTDARLEAVIVFSGRTPASTLSKKERELRQILADNSIEATGSARHYYYNDPFTLPWRRRNEVALTVK